MAKVLDPLYWPMRPGDEPLYLAIIETNATQGSDVLRICSGAEPFRDQTNGDLYQPIIDTVTSLSAEIDPLTREFTIGEISISCLDETFPSKVGYGTLRQFVVDHRMFGQVCTVYLGNRRMTELSHFSVVGTRYIIEDVLPSTMGIEIQLGEPGTIFVEEKINKRTFTNRHPLEILQDYALQGAAAAGLPAVIDRASFDPANYPTISHFNVTRGPISSVSFAVGLNGRDTTVNRDKTVNEAISQVLALVQGSIVPNDLGQYRFELYDSTKKPERHWTRNDIVSFEQQETYANLRNQFDFKGVWRAATTMGAGQGGATQSTPTNGADSFSIGLPFTHPTSPAEHALPGGQPRIVEEEYGDITGEWMQGIGVLRMPTDLATRYQNYPNLDVLNPTSLILEVTHAGFTGFSGAGFDGTSSRSTALAQVAPAERRINRSRPAYLALRYRDGSAAARIQGTPGTTGTPERGRLAFATEIIECHAAVPVASVPPSSNDIVPNAAPGALNARLASGPGGNFFPRNMQYSIFRRGVLGTRTPDAWLERNTYVFDITPMVYASQILLDRFSYGTPMLVVRTDLSQFDLQIGDFVTLSDDIFLNRGYGVANAANVFEIVRKEVQALEDEPGIEWHLAWAREDVNNPVNLASAPSVDQTLEIVTPPSLASAPVLTADGAQVTIPSGEVYMTSYG